MGRTTKTKKRSFVAAFISFIGSIVMVLGLYLALTEIFIMVVSDGGKTATVILGILVIILSGFIQFGSVLFDRMMEHQKWTKRLKNAGIEEQLAEDSELCWQAYRSNPTAMGLRYIASHNADAAADIQAYLAEHPLSFRDKLQGKKPTLPPATKQYISKAEPKVQQNWADGETIIR